MAGDDSTKFAAGKDFPLPEISLVYQDTMTPDEWSDLSSALHQKLITKQASTRQACTRADAAEDDKLAKERQEAKFRATATNEECRGP